MQVRDENRAKIQPYIYAHPTGGGLGTTGVLGLKYSGNHQLAGFPTDSGLLKAALETGWIGLILQCLLYFIILQHGIRAFYRTKKAIAKKYLLAALVVIFSNIVAQYSQTAIGQIPEGFFFYALVAAIVKINYFNRVQTKHVTLTTEI
jgi:cell division protein FtsW (lipid II flippase)